MIRTKKKINKEQCTEIPSIMTVTYHEVIILLQFLRFEILFYGRISKIGTRITNIDNYIM